MHTSRLRRSILVLALAHTGCATTRSSGGDPDHIKMDPIVVRGGTDPLTGLDGYDASQLLELGNELYAKTDHARAVQVFQRLIETFPDSELVPSAIYNSGLAYEQLSDWPNALARFQAIVKDHPRASSYKDALFRSAFALAKLERWTETADTFWTARQLPALTTMDELEARIGMGVAFFMQNDYATAEKELLSALNFHEAKSKEEFLPADYFIGQARFYLGEMVAREFEKLKLSEPDMTKEGWEERMGERLEEKCQLLLRAQNNLIRTIRVGHPGWATAAGFRIGSLYESLYDDVTHIPAPPALGEDAQEFYLGELRKKVGVLVSKAIQIYEQSLEMATRVRESNEWVEKTSKSLERMKALALQEVNSG